MDAVVSRIRRVGPIPFAEFMELALYGDGGFYDAGGGAGRRGRDFITSPEVGDLFGAVIARALDTWWRELKQPDPFIVAEAGAGRGTLAASILRAAPECTPALRYVVCERSPAARAHAAHALPIAPPAVALAGEGHGGGPVVAALDDLPTGPFTGVIVANELLDNLPVRVLERSTDGWREVFVGLANDESSLVEMAVPADGDSAERAESLASSSSVGNRIPLHDHALEWVGRARRALERGRVVAFDYGVAATAELTSRPDTGWLRTYREHAAGDHPLRSVGAQDITSDVAFDQLDPDRVVSQTSWLDAHGLPELVAAARHTWDERAAIGDLQALKARSRLSEAAALTDPQGLGAFLVAEWDA